MSDRSPPEPASDAPQSRWQLAVAGEGAVRPEALRELAGSYWYCVYVWWRRTGLEAEEAAAATLSAFTRWIDELPPRAEDSGAARMREWLPGALIGLVDERPLIATPPAIAIDPAWAEKRYRDEPEGEVEAIFQRRWALTVLELGAASLKAEYESRGEAALLDELFPFAGFEPSDEARYAAAAGRLGCTSGAMRKAVFNFRVRQREVLRALASDTVLDSAETDSEFTTLMCALDTPGQEAGPLPSGIQGLRPDEVFARAMQSVHMSGGGPGMWQPPSLMEIARLFPLFEFISFVGRGGMGAV